MVLTKPLFGGGASLTWYADPNASNGLKRRRQVEVRHPDGTIAEFRIIGSPAKPIYYATRLTDPYDNVTTLHYDAASRLSEICYPNGVIEHWSYDPTWDTAQYPGIEVTYTLPGTPALPAGDLAWGMAFDGTQAVAQNQVAVPFSNAPLWRIFYPKTEAVDDLSPGQIGAANISIASAKVEHSVVELDYSTIGPVCLISKQLQGRSPVMTVGVIGNLVPVVEVDYSVGPDGISRVSEQREYPSLATGSGPRVRTFSYTFGAGPVLTSIVETDPRGMLFESGSLDIAGRPKTYKVYAPSTGAIRAALLPREAALASGEYSSLASGSMTAIAEPGVMEVSYDYSISCGACTLPTRALEVSGTTTRETLFTYNSETRRTLTATVPNPSTAGGAPVTTTYTYVKATMPQATDYTAEYLGSVTGPDGTWNWTYTWVDRVTPSGVGGFPVQSYGKKPSQVVTSSPSGVSPQVTSTVQMNVSAPSMVSHGSGERQTALVGQVTLLTDGNGVSTEYAYDSQGTILRATGNPQGAAADRVVTEFDVDEWGRVTSVIANVGSALQQSAALNSTLGGHPLGVTVTAGGVTREVRTYLDRWGHQAVVLRSNKNSSGAAPDDFGTPPRSDVARSWLRDEFHWVGDRLLAVLEDRRALDRDENGAIADAADARFLLTQFTYLPTGQILEAVGPNGAQAEFVWDGYGTLYKSRQTDGGSQAVAYQRTYVNQWLEPVRQFSGDASLKLWTNIERNAAGAVVKVTEPTGASPGSFYTGSLGGAEHSLTLDSMGRVREVLTRSGPGGTVLARAESWFDQLGRTYKVDEHSLLPTGVSTGILQARVFWQGMSQRSRVEQISNPGGSQTVRATENSYDALGRLIEVRTEGATPDKTRYVYKANTNFVEQVFRDMFDAAPTTGSPGIVTYRTDYVYDALGRVLQVKDYGTGSSDPLVNGFTYYSTGATESHIDPSGKVQWYLPDARSRLVEHFLPGTQPIWNGSEYRDWTNSSGRTELLRTDGRGRVTKTVFDFAGRPFVVMDPGAATEPTAAAKHQAFSRYMEYDSASRVSMIYSGEAADGKRIQAGLFYDGPGRLIARMSDSAAINTDVSFMSTWDVYTRDALGRVVQSKSSIAPLASPIDLTRVDRVEDSLGRVHSESFWNNPITASPLPGVTVEVKHTWTGADPFRSGLEYSYGASNPANLAMGYTPDLLGRMSTVSWNPTGSSATLATYAYQGSATSKKTIAYSSTVNGITDFAFDEHGRHSKIETLNGSAVLGKVEFFYDAASNLTKEKYAHYATGGVVRDGDRFFYDEHHRLADAWLGADTATFNTEPPPATPTLVKRVTYGLDAANNRTQVEISSGGTGSIETYTTDDDSTPSNRYTTVGAQAYLYDARGNLTFDGRFIYVYDYLNRLSEIWTFQTDSESEQMMASSSTSTGQRSVRRPESRRRFVVNNPAALFGARRSGLARQDRRPDVILRLASNPQTVHQLEGSIPAGTLSLASGGEAPTSSQALTDSSTIPTRMSPVAFYGYDGFERRTFRLVVASPYIFFYAYDGWQEVSEQITLDGSTATPTVQSVWGRELDELLAIRVNSEFGFATSYVAEGGAHCPQWLVNSAGVTIEQQQYDAYGATSHWVPGSPATPQSASPLQNPWGWKGHRVDPETGFVQMRHRYYSVVLGRFLTSDPLGVWGDFIHLGNQYAYGGNTPCVMSDPMGLQTRDYTDRELNGEYFPSGVRDYDRQHMKQKFPRQPGMSEERYNAEIDRQVDMQRERDRKKWLAVLIGLGVRITEANASADENCHTHTFLPGRTGWFNDPSVLIAPGGDYTPVKAAKVGDIIVYFAYVDGKLLPVHSGTVVEVDKDGVVTIRSKFGSGPVGEHHMRQVPASYTAGKPGRDPREPGPFMIFYRARDPYILDPIFDRPVPLVA